VLIALDQYSKQLALNYLPLGGAFEVFGDFFRLSLAHNPGGVWGTRIGGKEVYVGFAILGIVLITFYYIRFYLRSSVSYTISVALILSGAIGNLIDRLRFGLVTDFLDFGIGQHRWPTFNIADSSILIGIVILFLLELKKTVFEPQEIMEIPKIIRIDVPEDLPRTRLDHYLVQIAVPLSRSRIQQLIRERAD
jgi:signal peptidase II